MGKAMPGSRLLFTKRVGVLVALSLVRAIVLIPLFFLTNVKFASPELSDAQTVISEGILGDKSFLALVLLLGVSNGYCVTNSLMLAPRLVSDEKRQMVGDLFVVVIAVGLSVGSLLSFAVREAISYPFDETWIGSNSRTTLFH